MSPADMLSILLYIIAYKIISRLSEEEEFFFILGGGGGGGEGNGDWMSGATYLFIEFLH